VKPLLIGEMPSRSGDRYHAFPLSGAVAQTLCQLAGIPPQEGGTRYGRWTWALYDAFDAVNAIKRHGPWNSDAAAANLRKAVESDREVVVLLGRRPQSAYARMTFPAESPVARHENGASVGYFDWIVDTNSPTGRRQVVVIPHPSSLNRVYNSQHARWRAGIELQAAIIMAKQMHETRL
jgi:uracil-DNA glycosylase